MGAGARDANGGGASRTSGRGEHNSINRPGFRPDETVGTSHRSPSHPGAAQGRVAPEGLPAARNRWAQADEGTLTPLKGSTRQDPTPGGAINPKSRDNQQVHIATLRTCALPKPAFAGPIRPTRLRHKMQVVRKAADKARHPQPAVHEVQRRRPLDARRSDRPYGLPSRSVSGMEPSRYGLGRPAPCSRLIKILHENASRRAAAPVSVERG